MSNVSANQRTPCRSTTSSLDHCQQQGILALKMSPHETAGARALEASPRIHDLLQRLHAASEAQERSFSQLFFYLRMLAGHYIWNAGWSTAADDHMRDKFVSLERDKCQLLYLLTRSIGAKNIIEAGTSFGVSTIYLALAVGQNVRDAKMATGTSVTGKVIATENEPTKAEGARNYWKQAGNEVEPWIELREGDLRETLKVAEGMPEQIDMLLLDSKCCACASEEVATKREN